MNKNEILAKYKKLQNGSDIRGVALEGVKNQDVNLSLEEVFNISRGFTNWLSEKTNKPLSQLKIAVGRDSRISGPSLMTACLNGIMKEEGKAINTELSSTPAMFMSTVFPEIKADGAIMLTASHLPWNRNGMKFFSPSGGLNKSDISEILEFASAYELCDPNKSYGVTKNYNLMNRYSSHLRDLIIKGVNQGSNISKEDIKTPLKGMRILVDAGNGAGGFFATDVLAPLGADTSGSLFLNPDGTFPNHPPNPEDPEALDCLCKEVISRSADLGLIFDTDVDRIAAVDSKGKEIARNNIVALAAVLAQEKNPSTTIVTDSVTSSQLKQFIEDDLGLRHHRFKRGYRNVINEAIRLNESGIDSQLAMETSGHGAFKDNYFLDDGAYLATLITIKACLLKKEGKEISSILEKLSEPMEAIEIRLPITCENFQAYGDKVLKDLKSWAQEIKDPDIQIESPNFEGVRIKLSGKHSKGWFLLRKSLHDPLLPLNIESDEDGGSNKIKDLIRPFMAKYEFLDTKNL